MKVLVLGGDGYLGWPTAMYFSMKGHEVAVADNMIKRFWEAEIGVEPLNPVPTLYARVKRWKENTGRDIKLFVGDIARNPRFAYRLFEDFNPDAIIHYAEQPSAPYSMMDREKCVQTQINNVAGTLNVLFGLRHVCPDAHVIKLGTMGEYGTPNIDIEEGWLELEHNGRRDRVLFPKKPGSFYHLSKVHDSHNLEFACRIWGCRVTDLNQGVVYGIDTDETDRDDEFRTSFHYDAVFGTVLNRFVVQAVHGLPLTVYGKGHQTRGFLNIRDTLRCVELAALNPPQAGEFRVFNQFTEQFSVMDLAERVRAVAKSRGLDVKIDHIPNPRIEAEEHYYNAKHSALPALGLKPHLLTEEFLDGMIAMVQNIHGRIESVDRGARREVATAMSAFARSFSISGRAVGGEAPCYVIVEAGVAHFGNVDKAYALVDLAVDAKADAVKFQHFRSDRLVGPSSPEWRDRLRRRELSDDDMQRVADYARKRGVTFLCTAHDEPALDFLDRTVGVPAFKIGSGEVENWPYIGEIGRRGKPVIISTGMYTSDLIRKALDVLSENGCKEVAVLHCVTSYPADPATINLDAMRQIGEFFDGPVGYSDHTSGTAVALASVALGAEVLEKHIALDFDVPDAQDWKVSCGPDDLAKFIADVRAVTAARGGEQRRLSVNEEQSLLWARKSLTAARDIAAGERVEAAMLLSQRPGDGVPPSQLPSLLGRRARHAIAAGVKISLDMFDSQ